MVKAKAECTCTKCGNSFTKMRSCANRTDSENWKSWAIKNIDVCDDCRKNEFIEECNNKNEEAAEKTESMNLPDLKGSEKQISWATTIRMEAIEAVDEYITFLTEETEKKPELKDKTAETISIVEEALNKVTSEETHSRFWIDNRGRFQRRNKDVREALGVVQFIVRTSNR